MKRTVAAGAMIGCFLAANGCKKNGADLNEEIPVDSSPVVHSEISPRAPKGCGVVYGIHYGDAYKTLREAEDYKAGARTYYVRELSDRRNEYLLAGISPSFRKEWLTSHRTAEKDYPCIVPVFDEIGAAAKRTIQKYRPRGYTHHDSGEEQLMVAEPSLGPNVRPQSVELQEKLKRADESMAHRSHPNR